MRWSENETYQLVKIYLSHEFLWNNKHTNYNVKARRLKAYRDIITELNETTGILLNETELKIKIRSLKSTYSQEVAKIKRRSGPTWTYTPNMKWFAEWHRCFGGSKTISDDHSVANPQNNTEDPKVWLSQNDEIIDETLDPFPEAEDEYTIILKTEPRDANHINKDSTCQQPDSSQRYENKKMKLKRRSPSIEYSTARSSTDTDFSTKEDEFDIYGKYIASQLRRMELEKALRVQLEIQSLVSEARISELSNEH